MHEIVERAFGEGRNLLEPEALTLLDRYGLPVPRYEHVRTPQAALAAARRIGYPVVLKVVSKDIVHKSEAGGVRVGIAGDDALKSAWEEISHQSKTTGAAAGSSAGRINCCPVGGNPISSRNLRSATCTPGTGRNVPGVVPLLVRVRS